MSQVQLQDFRTRYGNFTLASTSARIQFIMGYNPTLQAEIKTLKGWKYDGDEPKKDRRWSAANVPRNHIQILKWCGLDIYTRVAPKLEGPGPVQSAAELPLRTHQINGYRFAKQVPQCMLAHDPGLGKTVTAFKIIEYYTHNYPEASVLWVTKKNVKATTIFEHYLWQCKVKRTYTPGTPGFYLTHYEALRRVLSSWDPTRPAPTVFVGDECQSFKTHDSIRTKSGQYIIEAMRDECRQRANPDCKLPRPPADSPLWDHDGKVNAVPGGLKPVVLFLTGTPDPDKPTDWWSQIEMLAPGFIPQGSVELLERDLSFSALHEAKGRKFWKRKSWRDDTNKCDECGETRDVHTPAHLASAKQKQHPFRPSINKVTTFAATLAPLVHTVKKADCADMPAKNYIVKQLTIPKDLFLAAKLITANTAGTAQQLTKLRSISDGFLYEEEYTRTACKDCARGQQTERWSDAPIYDGQSPPPAEPDCFGCLDMGYTLKEGRVTKQLHDIKHQAMLDTVNEYKANGHDRALVFCGFQASNDGACDKLNKNGWDVIKLDSRGCFYIPAGGQPMALKRAELRTLFDTPPDPQRPPMAFVAHPGSGGIGLNMQRSRLTVYVSNDFRNEYRSQSEDRTHRLGITQHVDIVDLYLLPIDRLVRDTLDTKQRLETLTSGQIKACFDAMNDIVDAEEAAEAALPGEDITTE